MLVVIWSSSVEYTWLYSYSYSGLVWHRFFLTPAESRFKDLTISILCPGKSYSKFYGAKSSQFTNIQFSDIPTITMEISIDILNRKKWETLRKLWMHIISCFDLSILFVIHLPITLKTKYIQSRYHVEETFWFHLEKFIINHIPI